MRLLHQTLPSFVLLMACAICVSSATADTIVNVEAMIGEATLVNESLDGKKESIVVPTGKAAKQDPGTGKILLESSTMPNKVNAVVQAIAASAPDSDNQLSSEDGCSRGNAPHRLVPRPTYDEATAAALAAELEGLNSGELMMVMAVLINNAKHLCIDASTVATTIGLISATLPDEAASVVFVASLLDPDNSDRYRDEAERAAPAQSKEIRQAVKDVNEIRSNPNAVIPSQHEQPKQTRAKPKPPTKPNDVPPGGSIGKPPSPE